MFAALNSFLTRAVTGYFLNKSLRFRSSASAYLNRTFGTPTNNKIWTWSGWVKRGALGAAQDLFGGGSSATSYSYIGFQNTDVIRIWSLVSSSTQIDCSTTAVFRDPAAWYHVVLVVDTTQATNSSGVKLWVNGVQQTLTFSTYVQNSNTYLNSAALHSIATLNYTAAITDYFDGEMAEVNFVDGQALAPTAFGASSIYNQWLPIKYAGTYGTNGFYLPFNSVSTASYAGSFNGSSQYLTVPDNAAFTLGTNDFTMECWINVGNLPTAPLIAAQTNSALSVLSFYLLANSSGAFQPVLQNASGAYKSISGTVGSIVANTWCHVAFVRDGNTARAYVNGVQKGTVDVTGFTVRDSTDVFGVGGGGAYTSSPYAGYISNFRLVNGTCLYPSGTTFTPPTTALTAVTNTSLLTLQNSTIVDNSTNAFIITNTGTVVTSVQYPFTLAIAADSSGNANNWTPNNISLTAGSTYDSLTDVPTLTSATVANYATGNPLYTNSTASWVPFSMINGNLSWGSAATNANQVGVATMAMSGTNKTYWEVTIGTNFPSGYTQLGIALSTTSNISRNEGIFYRNDGSKSLNGSASAYGSSYTVGDVIGFTYDAAAGTLVCYKNNVSQGTLYSSGAGLSWVPAAACDNAGVGITYYNAYNFGQQPFVYTAPSGFLPLNTFNI